MVTREHIVKMIAKNNAQIKTYKSNLDENYLYHFEWVAENIFKLEWKNKMLKYVLALFDDATIKNVDESIKRLKDRFKDDLITRTLMQSSTNPLANLTSLWINECKQELIAEI
jgi:hypothetical protein